MAQFYRDPRYPWCGVAPGHPAPPHIPPHPIGVPGPNRAFPFNVRLFLKSLLTNTDKSQNPEHQYRYINRVDVPVQPVPYGMPMPIPVPAPAAAGAPQPAYFHPYYQPHAYFGHYPMTFPSYSAVPGAPLASHNPFQNQELPGATLHPHYGRTRAEVQRDEAEIRRQTEEATRRATNRWKPNAEPEDEFMVVDQDGRQSGLMSFATIDDVFGKDGRWLVGADGIAYFLKGFPIP